MGYISLEFLCIEKPAITIADTGLRQGNAPITYCSRENLIQMRDADADETHTECDDAKVRNEAKCSTF